jgi:benzoyl-CoA reductase/2-hydroxyglutaryl-CoA dehydratase subunit BcrC/BadD/HgdB
MDGIAQRYLGKTRCPRTYRPKTGSHEGDLVNRFGYLKTYAESFNVKGVILYTIRFCDTYGFDAPDMQEYLRSIGLSVLHIEDDYFLSHMQGLRTRVEAFVEMID